MFSAQLYCYLSPVEKQKSGLLVCFLPVSLRSCILKAKRKHSPNCVLICHPNNDYCKYQNKNGNFLIWCSPIYEFSVKIQQIQYTNIIFFLPKESRFGSDSLNFTFYSPKFF